MTNPTQKMWLLVPLGLLAAGCHPRAGRVETTQHELMHTSFEELPGWAAVLPPSLTTAKAHSGKYAVYVDQQQAYSLSYRARLGDLCPTHQPRRFTLSAWVWVPGFKDNAVIVATIASPDDPDHPFFRKELYLTDNGGFQQWKPVSRDLDLPDNIHGNSILTLYLWRVNATEPVYADDWRLTELR